MLTFPAVYCAVMIVIIVGMAIWKWDTPQRAELPNLATVIGVLGTFIGILIGLIDFDVRDIDGSIPGLLDSLKFAFITSVAGIGIAIILRFFIVPIGGYYRKSPSATLDTLADILRSGFEETNANAAALAEAVNSSQQINDDAAAVARATLLSKIDSVERALVNVLRKGFEKADANAAALAEAVNSFQQINENTAAVARAVTGEGESALLNKIDSMEQALVGEGESTLANILRNGFEQTNASAAALAEAVNSFQQINENTAAVARAVTGEGESALLNKIESVEQALVGEGESTLLAQMREMRATFSDKQDELINKVGAVERALNGEGESTLLAQMQEMRSTFSDKQDELIDEFKRFAEKTADISSKALIEALEKVIRDFNEKITEQFGDNFRQLNEAVGQLLTWQENYKGQVDAMVGQLQTSMEALEMCEAAMIVVTEQSEAFAGVADRLEETLGELSGRNEEMNAHLEALAGLGERAESAFPAIQQNIKQITDGLTTTANGFTESAGAALRTMANQRTLIETNQRTVNERIHRTATSFKSSVEASLESMGAQREMIEKNQAEVNAQLKASLEGQQALMAENQKQVSAQIYATASEFKTAASSALLSMDSQRKRIIDNQNTVNAQIQETAEEFKTSVDASLESMSGQRDLIETNQEAVNAQIQKTADALESAAQDALDSISQIVRDTGESLRRQTTELDRTLKEQLAISLNTLADQLASISGKFVEDYKPLADRLREVVRIAEDLNRRFPPADTPPRNQF